jgi:hypothetical protein
LLQAFQDARLEHLGSEFGVGRFNFGHILR